MKRNTPHSVAIVGLGNWGSSLAHALQAADVPLHEVILSGRRRPSVGPARRVQSLPLTTLQRATLQADILWLCVPDAVIAEVTRCLVARAVSLGMSLRKKLVVHSSGALGTVVLHPAALAGASVAAVHPMMSFPTRKPVSLRGIPFGIEAQAGGRRILDPIIRRIGGRPFLIPAGKKALYHAVGVLASPLLVSHLAAAQQAAELAGFSPRAAQALIEPIVRATMDNVFAQGHAKSVSGPIARGDIETIRLHLRALEPHPMVAGIYRSLALFALSTMPASKSKELRRLLRSK